MNITQNQYVVIGDIVLHQSKSAKSVPILLATRTDASTEMTKTEPIRISNIMRKTSIPTRNELTNPWVNQKDSNSKSFRSAAAEKIVHAKKTGWHLVKEFKTKLKSRQSVGRSQSDENSDDDVFYTQF